MARSMDEINDSTGFANGDEFESAQEVEEYFTVENMRDMFSGYCNLSQSELNRYARVVIEEKWHCKF